MLQNSTMLHLLEAGEQRRTERRRFLRAAGGAAAAAGGVALLSGCGGDGQSAPSNPGTTTPPAANPDADVLNFALNLEYLEASFYSYAVFGSGLSAAQTGGTGTMGAVTGGRKVSFTDAAVAAYALEIAQDEVAHVNFLRAQLGTSSVALPALNIDGGASGAFTAAARAAGVIGPNDAFDPYASDENFLLAAFIFEDVGVSAYKGASPLITSKTYLEAAAGILAAEAYHAGLIRTTLYAKGLQTPALRTAAGQISDARDSLDGSTDLDQGIVGSDGNANIVPADDNAIAFSRTTSQVLNIVYLNKGAASSGGFFPSGLNGSIKTSTAAT